jgi:hypothetical protein
MAIQAPYANLLGGQQAGTGTTTDPGSLPPAAQPPVDKKKKPFYGMGEQNPDAENKEGGVQQNKNIQDTRVGAGMIGDIENFAGAAMAGSSATGGLSTIGFGYNMATGGFTAPRGNWNQLSGFETEVQKLVDGGMTATQAQNQVAVARAGQGQLPEGYKPGSMPDVDRAYGGRAAGVADAASQKAGFKSRADQNAAQGRGGGGAGGAGGAGGKSAGGFGSRERAASDKAKGKGGL